MGSLRQQNQQLLSVVSCQATTIEQLTSGSGDASAREQQQQKTLVEQAMQLNELHKELAALRQAKANVTVPCSSSRATPKCASHAVVTEVPMETNQCQNQPAEVNRKLGQPQTSRQRPPEVPSQSPALRGGPRSVDSSPLNRERRPRSASLVRAGFNAACGNSAHCSKASSPSAGSAATRQKSADCRSGVGKERVLDDALAAAPRGRPPVGPALGQRR